MRRPENGSNVVRAVPMPFSTYQGCALSSVDERWLETACERLTLSLRSAHRLLKVARTLADLEQVDAITRSHLAEALQYRPSTN
ncbi:MULTISPECIES: Mg chelatase-like protein [Pseudomonas syringae group]|uniref:magnesium chelatase subunit ChlI family protein n=1 Tax=Pseudomonas syringae group TaxID=136849 RepID=UPI001E4CFBC4|nr:MULTISPECIES: Mg chelatase-like protein [Pseudomonas syringae group]